MTTLALSLSVRIEAKAEDLLPHAGFTTFVNEIDTFIEAPKRTNYLINNHNGMKTFMSYKAITNKTSYQYKLQQDAYTDELGFRKIEDMYCVAIGTAFNAKVGTLFDVTLDNGEIIHCIVGDIKADKDTDASNVFTNQGCCLEFIVDTKQLYGTIKQSGNCSSKCDEWNSPCVEFKIYDELNYFVEEGEVE